MKPPANPSPSAGSEHKIPRVDRQIIETFARMDAVAFGCATAALTALAVLGATAFLLLKGGERIGPTLALLGQYFPGYTVTWTGCAVGFGYGLIAGFLIGWLSAIVRNSAVAFYLFAIRKKAELFALNEYLD